MEIYSATRTLSKILPRFGFLKVRYRGVKKSADRLFVPWVHVWASHAIPPQVTVDTRLIERDFNIR
jgi:hypothetical protein